MILKFHKQRLKRDCTWPQEQKLAVKIQQNSLYNYANSIFILPVTSHTPQNFVEFYNELWNVRDRRLDDWFMMSSIWPTVTLCVFYWYCSIVLGKVFHLGVHIDKCLGVSYKGQLRVPWTTSFSDNFSLF